jgi:regulator of PEP synthase PpsR (kinase-PPPase family)
VRSVHDAVSSERILAARDALVEVLKDNPGRFKNVRPERATPVAVDNAAASLIESEKTRYREELARVGELVKRQNVDEYLYDDDDE